MCKHPNPTVGEAGTPIWREIQSWSASHDVVGDFSGFALSTLSRPGRRLHISSPCSAYSRWLYSNNFKLCPEFLQTSVKVPECSSITFGSRSCQRRVTKPSCNILSTTGAFQTSIEKMLGNIGADTSLETLTVAFWFLSKLSTFWVAMESPRDRFSNDFRVSATLTMSFSE